MKRNQLKQFGRYPFMDVFRQFYMYLIVHLFSNCTKIGFELNSLIFTRLVVWVTVRSVLEWCLYSIRV